MRECSRTTTQLIQHHFWHLRHSVFSGITDSYGTVEVSLELLIKGGSGEIQTSFFLCYILGDFAAITTWCSVKHEQVKKIKYITNIYFRFAFFLINFLLKNSEKCVQSHFLFFKLIAYHHYSALSNQRYLKCSTGVKNWLQNTKRQPIQRKPTGHILVFLFGYKKFSSQLYF